MLQGLKILLAWFPAGGSRPVCVQAATGSGREEKQEAGHSHKVSDLERWRARAERSLHAPCLFSQIMETQGFGRSGLAPCKIV